MTKPRIAVHGACGRLGRRMVEAIHADPELELAGAIESPGHRQLDQDVGTLCGIGPVGIPLRAELPRRVDGVIDFSVPAASLAIAQACAARAIPILVATTGHSAAQREELIALHHTTPLLFAANTSLVVNVLFRLAAAAARALKGRDFDVEIIERHHRFKVDAPSGTALAFAEVIEREMGLNQRVFGREGIVGRRPSGELGLHAIRGGDNVGEHTILFTTLGESLELVHKGHSLDSYVKGALAAIKFLVAQKPGLYTMADVLGLG